MIYMCNYYGMCDDEDRAVGHSIKVTEEYANILKNIDEVSLCASPCIVEGLSKNINLSVYRLPYNIRINGNGIGKRIIDKFKLIENIRRCMKNEGILFFYQVDFFFFFYINYFYRKRANRKVVLLIYHCDFTLGRCGKLLDTFFRNALKKMDAVVFTQPGISMGCDHTYWIPDYMYDSRQYDSSLSRERRAVCLGTMNRYKKLEELVEAWKNVDIPLLIAGRFDSDERYHRLNNSRPENVSIRNEILDYQEYKELLMTSVYSILPYDMGQYVNRTSGVLLETIYMGAIPVAPKNLLEQNKLPGIGYCSLDEIGNDGLKYNDELPMQMKDVCLRYSIETAGQTLRDCFNRVRES